MPDCVRVTPPVLLTHRLGGGELVIVPVPAPDPDARSVTFTLGVSVELLDVNAVLV